MIPSEQLWQDLQRSDGGQIGLMEKGDFLKSSLGTRLDVPIGE